MTAYASDNMPLAEDAAVTMRASWLVPAAAWISATHGPRGNTLQLSTLLAPQ